MFFGCNAPPDSKVTKLGSCDKETSASISKTTGVVLESCRPCKYVAVSSGVSISICLTTDEFSGRVKNSSRLSASFTHNPRIALYHTF